MIIKLKFYILSLSGIFVLTAILLISAVYAATFIDDAESEFNAGTHLNTIWDAGHVELSSGQTSGTFTSQVFDAGDTANWSQIQWSETLVSVDKLIAVDGAADVWKSTDNASTWGLVKDDYNDSEGNNVDDMAKDSSGNIFILNNQDVWKSTDSGVSWTKINDDYNGSEGQNGKRIALDSGNNLYIAEGDEDIWMSADNGINWTKQAVNINGGSGYIKGFCGVDSSLYAVDGAADVWKSTDNASTWGLVKDDYNGTDGNDASYMVCGADSNLYIAHNQNVWKSTDSGVSWTKINNDYNGSEGQNAIVMAINSSGYLFIAEGDEDIWMSADNGINWTKQAVNINGGNGNIFGMVYVSVLTDITFAARSGNANPPTDSFSGSLTDPAGGSPGVSNSRYFQYRASFSSGDNGVTPELFSATITYSLLDAAAPAAVDDLQVTTPSDSAITVSWTAPGDDGSIGTAASYDLRYSTSLITSENWSLADQVSGESAPFAAGSLESIVVSGLLPNTTYYFALKTSDEVPNESELSNVPSLATDKRNISLAADSQNKVYGESDSVLTYQITEGSLIEGDAFIGSLVRAVGENAGVYAISLGSLSASEKYNVNFTGADLTINKRQITVTAVTDSKVYDGTANSTGIPTITAGSLAPGDTATWTQSFDTADVGTRKTLISLGTVNDGNGGNNYDVTFVNDTTGVITAQPSSGGGSGGGGGGGGPAPEPALIISELQSPNITIDTLTLTWTTNFLSSSYVIYSAEGEPHSLNMTDNTGTPPKYGYARATAESNTDPKVISHSITITGLNPSTTYNFRTVSRGSLAISGEYKITTPAISGARIIEQTTEGQTTGGETIEQSGEAVNIPQQIEEAPEIQPVSSETTPEETINPPVVAGLENQLAAVNQAVSNPNLFAAFAAGFREILGKIFGLKIFTFIVTFLIIAIAIIVLVFLFFPPARWFKKK